MSTTLVNIDADTSVKLATYVSRLSKDTDLLKSANELINSNKLGELILLLLTKLNDIFELDNSDEIEGIIQAMISVLFSTENKNMNEITLKIADILISSKISQCETRIKSLISIFNMTILSEVKYNILIKIFDYSIDTKQTSLVAQFHSRIENWIIQWKLNKAEVRKTYFLISKILSIEKLSSEVKFKILYLKTLNGEDYNSEANDIATETVISAICSPISNFSDRNAILQNVVIPKNQQVGDLSSLVELLKIICNGSLDLYERFIASPANLAIIKKFNIESSALSTTMKLLTLCSLVTSAQNSTITYDDIAKALKIDFTEVEFWVVDCISNGLIDGSMDQSTNTVKINKSTHRSFNIEQWKSLQSKVISLRKNVSEILLKLK